MRQEHGPLMLPAPPNIALEPSRLLSVERVGRGARLSANVRLSVCDGLFTRNHVTELEELWRRKNDEQLFEAFAYLEEYSEEGQGVIRAEFLRRGLVERSKRSITFQEAAAVATLRRRLVGFVAAQWLSLIAIVFIAPILPRDVGSVCPGSA